MLKKTTLLFLLTVTVIAVAQQKKILLIPTNGTINNAVEIPLKDNTTLTVDTNTGNIIATTSFQNDKFCTDIINGTRDCNSVINNPDVPTVTLSANPSQVSSGGSTTLSYTIGTVNASECVKSGAWSGTLTSNTSNLTQGTHTETVSNITSTNSYGLKCKNGASAYSNIAATTVTVQSVVAGCQNSPPLAGASGFTRRAPFTLAEAYNNIGTWVYSGQNNYITLKPKEYVAYKFTADHAQLYRIVTEASNGPPTYVSASISKCPGVFDETSLGTDCHTSGAESIGTLWINSGTTPINGICNITVGQDYYVNYVWAKKSQNNYNDIGCTHNECVMLNLQVQ